MRGANVDPCSTSGVSKRHRSEKALPSINKLSNQQATTSFNKRQTLHGRNSERMPVQPSSNLQQMPRFSNPDQPKRPKSKRFPKNCFQQYGYYSSDEEEIPVFDSRKKRLPGLKLPKVTGVSVDEVKEDLRRFKTCSSSNSIPSRNVSELDYSSEEEKTPVCDFRKKKMPGLELPQMTGMAVEDMKEDTQRFRICSSPNDILSRNIPTLEYSSDEEVPCFDSRKKKLISLKLPQLTANHVNETKEDLRRFKTCISSSTISSRVVSPLGHSSEEEEVPVFGYGKKKPPGMKFAAWTGTPMEDSKEEARRFKTRSPSSAIASRDVTPLEYCSAEDTPVFYSREKKVLSLKLPQLNFNPVEDVKEDFRRFKICASPSTVSSRNSSSLGHKQDSGLRSELVRLQDSSLGDYRAMPSRPTPEEREEGFQRYGGRTYFHKYGRR